jgi:hypothetical protein
MFKKLKIYIAILVILGLTLSLMAQQSSQRRERSRDHKIEFPSSEILGDQSDKLVPLPFFENFESGLGAWMTTGQWNVIQNAQNYFILNPNINPNLVTLPDNGRLPTAYGGNGMAWFGETATGTFIGPGWVTVEQFTLNGGTSDTTQFGWLISPPIDLTGTSNAILQFKTWWEIEGVDVDAFDLMGVFASPDNGATWYFIGRSWINPLNDVDGESWKPYSSGGLGQPGIWFEQVFDLTPFVGNMVNIGFWFSTEDELYNGFRGWFIDDVSVTGNSLPAPNITSVSPSTSASGELIKVFGQNFVNGATVSVGESVVSAVISTNLAEFQAPSLIEGTYDVTLTNPDGQSDTEVGGLTITLTSPPAFDDFNPIDPDTIELGSSVMLTINGFNFVSGATVNFDGFYLLSPTVVDELTITGMSPTDLPAGLHNITVINPDLQSDFAPLAFYVLDPTGIDNSELTINPTEFSLYQNYPNPFNPSTTITYHLPKTAETQLSIFNTLGELVETINLGNKSAGMHSFNYSGENLNSGIYFYRITSGQYTATRKFVLMK